MHDRDLSIVSPASCLFTNMRSHLASLGVSAELVMVVLCGVISLLAQGAADILWPGGRRTRVGVSGVVVGHSGSGKTLIYNLLMEAIERYIADSAARDEGWDFLLEDTTLAAIGPHMKLHRFAGLFTDEGGGLYHLQRGAPTIAKLIDGTPLRKARGNADPTSLAGHRLLMLLLLQPHAAEQTKLFSMLPGDIGLLNRCYTALASPIVGSLDTVGLPTLLAEQHRARVYELLNAAREHVRNKSAQLPALDLSAGAREFFKDIASEARRQSAAAAHRWSASNEYLSRHGERTLQQSGALHLYIHGLAGLHLPVAQRTVQIAHEIGVASSIAYEQLSYRPTPVEKDAEQLLQALRQYHLTTGLHFVVLASLYRNAPNILMTRQRIKAALPLLVGAGHVWVTTGGKDDVLHFRFSSPFLRGRFW